MQPPTPRPTAPAEPHQERLSPPCRWPFRDEADKPTERLALRAVLGAARLFGLATGTHLRQLRSSHDPLLRLRAQLEEAQLQARLAWEIVEILSESLPQDPRDAHRPHYSPAQRFRALEIRNLLGRSRQITARVFLVCPNTISNWETLRRSSRPHRGRDRQAHPSRPPLRRHRARNRATPRPLRHGARTRARSTLARAGWRVSAALHPQDRPHTPGQRLSPTSSPTEAARTR